MINNASYDLTDIMYLTPVVMQYIIEDYEKFSPYAINPKTIVIDEFDELIRNPATSLHLFQILDYFGYFD